MPHGSFAPRWGLASTRWPGLALSLGLGASGLSLSACAGPGAAPPPPAGPSDLGPQAEAPASRGWSPQELSLPTDRFDWAAHGLTTGLPKPVVPADNPMSEAKVALGRRLFFDPRLSGNGKQACASCHLPDQAFHDGKAVSEGSTGQHTKRNAQGLANVGYFTTLTWANPALDSLERQALVPLFGEDPVELGLSGREQEAIVRLAQVPGYLEGFARAFPELKASGEAGASPSLGHLAKALSAFQRSLLSFNSPYDAWSRGDRQALSPAALRGMARFNSEELECFHCHTGLLFSDNARFVGQSSPESGFHNTGLYHLNPQGAYPEGNQGLVETTGKAQDMGAFRTPSLRNLSRGAPYFHDGSAKDLPEVLAHYRAGGRTLTGPFAGVGATNPHKSSFVRGFALSEAEQAELLAFLQALEDPTFGRQAEHQDPWRTP